MNFLTREERSRRLLRVTGIPFAQPAPPTPVVCAAFVLQRAIYRSDTERRLQKLPEWWDHPLGVPTAPAVYASLVRSTAIRRRDTHRQLGTLPTDVWNYPTTSRPGDNYRALAEPIVTRETASRRLLRSPEILSAPQPPVPSVYASLVRMEAIRRTVTKRHLRRLANVREHFAELPTGDEYPSFLTREAHRRHGWRHHLRVAELDTRSLTPSADNAPYVAAQLPKAFRRQTRHGLFLIPDEASESRVTAQYPSYEPSGFFRRAGTERRLLHTITPQFEPTPAVPEQPLTAWLAPCANRRQGVTRHQTVAEVNEYPATPAVAEQPLSALVGREPFHRHGWRVRQSLPGLDRYPRTVGQDEASFPGWVPPRPIRRCGWRVLRAIERMPENAPLPAGHQPYGAWLAREVVRREGWRSRVAVLGLGDYGEPVEPAEVINLVERTIRFTVRTERTTFFGETINRDVEF